LRDSLYDDAINRGDNTNESVCLFYRMTAVKLSTLFPEAMRRLAFFPLRFVFIKKPH